jgi:hypothetical protein
LKNNEPEGAVEGAARGRKLINFYVDSIEKQLSEEGKAERSFVSCEHMKTVAFLVKIHFIKNPFTFAAFSNTLLMFNFLTPIDR